MSEGMIDNIPDAQCSRCGAYQPDYDGFGVVSCDKCKHCVHPSESWISDTQVQCDLCKRVVEQPRPTRRGGAA